MEFQMHTTYDRPAMTVMARASRKTINQKRNRFFHVWIYAVLLLGILCAIPLDGTLTSSNIISGLVAIFMLATRILEDHLDGWIAYRCVLPGTEQVDATFTPEQYCTKSKISTTKWSYETIAAVAESPRYFIFILGQKHAQIYDKPSLTGGNFEQFRALLETATGKPIFPIK